MIHFLFKNNILRAYGTSLLGVASGLLTNLWLLREITRVVPMHDFGIYAYVLQITAYLSILQLGLDFAASREIAECLGRQDLAGANRAFLDLWRFNRRIVFLGVAGVAGISALLWLGIGLKIGSDSRTAHLASEIVWITGASQLVTFFSRPYIAALFGSQYQATANILTVIRTITTTLLAFGLLKSGFYIFSVPVAEGVTQLLALFVLRDQVEEKCGWIRSAPDSLIERKGLNPMFKFGALATLGGVAWTIEGSMDVVILGYLINVKEVAAYVLWWRFPQMLFDFSSRLTTSAFPSFSHKFGVSHQAARLLLGKVVDLSAGLATLSLVGISFWLRPFVQLWIGTAYTGKQSLYLPFLMGMLVCLRTGGNLFAMFWLASGHAQMTTVLSWCQALLKLLLALWLVPRLGIVGVVLASCAAAILQVGMMAFHLLRKQLLPWACIVRFLVLGGLAILLSYFGVQYPQMVGWGWLIAGVMATTAVWGALWLPVVLTGELRIPLQTVWAGAVKWLPFARPV